MIFGCELVGGSISMIMILESVTAIASSRANAAPRENGRAPATTKVEEAVGRSFKTATPRHLNGRERMLLPSLSTLPPPTTSIALIYPATYSRYFLFVRPRQS